MDTQVKPQIVIASSMASLHHEGIARKYTGEPYYEHCNRVANRILKWGVNNADVISAAYLHDFLEDENFHGQKGSEQAILEKLNPSVLRYVKFLTEPTSGNRKFRMDRYLEQLKSAPDEVKLIKLADISDNVSNIVEHDPAFARTYVGEKIEQWIAIKSTMGARWNAPAIEVMKELQTQLDKLDHFDSEKERVMSERRRRQQEELDSLARQLAAEKFPDLQMF